EYPLRFDGLRDSWIRGAGGTTDASLARQSIQLPESIVDGVITDTTLVNVTRVVQACLSAGLDDPKLTAGLPMDSRLADQRRTFGDLAGTIPTSYHDEARREELRAELGSVEAELARISSHEHSADIVRRRHDQLQARLEGLQRQQYHYTTDSQANADRHRLRNELASVHDQISRLHRDREELLRWVRDLETDATSTADRYRYGLRDNAYAMDRRLQSQLSQIDSQLLHLRRALVEVQSLASWTGTADRYAGHFDGFVRALDHYDERPSWDRFYQHYQPLSAAEELTHRIDTASRQIEWLLSHYSTAGGSAELDREWDRYLSAVPTGRPYARDTSEFGSDPIGLTDALNQVRVELNRLRDESSAYVHRRSETGSGYAAATTGYLDRPYVGHATQMRRSEQLLASAIERLTQYRERLVRDYRVEGPVEAMGWMRHPHWSAERHTAMRQLDRVTTDLNRCLDRAANIRHTIRHLPVLESVQPRGLHWTEVEAIREELRQLDGQRGGAERVHWLRRRREQLIDQLQNATATRTTSSFAQNASGWLVRLSAGRLHRVDWDRQAIGRHDDGFVDSSLSRGAVIRQTVAVTGVRIDDRDERDCPSADRALAAMAVRMAAGDVLARLNRPVPLVFETHREFWAHSHADRSASAALFHYAADGRANQPFATALHDYAAQGRQVLLLTSNVAATEQIERAGGRVFRLHDERIVHPHRPLYRPHYAPEQYEGPHPHLHASEDWHRPDLGQRSANESVNRDFDISWREAYGLYDSPEIFGTRGADDHSVRSQPYYVREQEQMAARRASVQSPRDPSAYRDGFFHATSTTSLPANGRFVAGLSSHTMAQPGASANDHVGMETQDGHREVADSPFFLTVDSPIDQAPSVDAVAAARLRGVGITHINHLMQQDSNRLSDTLGLSNVNAATIRRWQHECRLVCRVPQLRGFDARVLVGCGVTDPAQLAAIHPSDLLERVQTFLATERGQRILLSGSSYELSRITSWIASANRTVSDEVGGVIIDGKRVSARLTRDSDDYDTDRYEYDSEGRPIRRRRVLREGGDNRATRAARDGSGTRSVGRRSTVRSGERNGPSSNGRSRAGSGSGRRSNGASRGSSSRSTSSRGRSSRARTSSRSGRDGLDRHNQFAAGLDLDPIDDGRDVVPIERSGAVSSVDAKRAECDDFDYERESSRRRQSRRRDQSSGSGSGRNTSQRGSSSGRQSSSRHERELRFYLSRDQDVVDAPSIGPRMAERLNGLGILTVNDLLQADAESLAADLSHRRIDADTILQWQQQATLVCRIPMLRGHDAQLLVAAEITTPEEVVSYEPETLLATIDPIARGREGTKILRGGKLPDLEEITEWIEYANQNRELVAA
ncbi:MAG: DUF4332 domain-containing protein, partial [Planctomycetota bacterium]